MVTFTFWLVLLLGASALIVRNLMRAPNLGKAARAEKREWDGPAQGR